MSSTEANRAGTEADVSTGGRRSSGWSRSSRRARSARHEFDQAQNSLRTAEAHLAALDAQVREGSVRAQYYRVVAPQAGHRRRHPGPRRRPRDDLDDDHDHRRQGQALEAYIQVPLDRSPRAARSACRSSSSTRTARSSRPIRSRSSRRASTTPRRPCSSRACCATCRRRCASCSSSARGSSGAPCRA